MNHPIISRIDVHPWFCFSCLKCSQLYLSHSMPLSITLSHSTPSLVYSHTQFWITKPQKPSHFFHFFLSHSSPPISSPLGGWFFLLSALVVCHHLLFVGRRSRSIGHRSWSIIIHGRRPLVVGHLSLLSSIKHRSSWSVVHPCLLLCSSRSPSNSNSSLFLSSFLKPKHDELKFLQICSFSFPLLLAGN